MKFSRYLILNEVCLGVAFTAQPFTNNTLGLSYTAEVNDENTYKITVGGICDRLLKHPATSTYNTLVVSGAFQNGMFC